MFGKIWNWIKEVVSGMLGPSTVGQLLHVEPVISQRMFDAIKLWDEMFKGKAPWIRSADASDPTKVVSLGLPSLIASEKARLATLEMKSEITDPDKQETTIKSNNGNDKNNKDKTGRAAYLNDIYQRKIVRKIRPQLEYGLAKGGLVIKPYPFKKVDKDGIESYDLGISYVHADAFYPLSFNDSGEVVEAAFIESKVDKNTIYNRLEHHRLEGNKVIVINRAFKKEMKQVNTFSGTKNENDLGNEIPLSMVPEWAHMDKETTIEGTDRLLFAYFREPEANTIDPLSPLGMSCYGRAVDLIRDADMQYSRIQWEYEATEAAIDIDRNALGDEKVGKGESSKFVSTRPYLQQRLFRKVDLGEDNTYEPFLPQIRDESLINGLNLILMKIEDECAISRGTLSNESIEAKTATELKILKQRSYSSNKDIQQALEDALSDAIYVMNIYCDLYEITPDGNYETSFEWGDSILVDKEEELQKRILLVNSGASSKAELRMWYFGETLSQAEEALKKINEENDAAILRNAKLQAQAAAQAGTLNNEKNPSVPSKETTGNGDDPNNKKSSQPLAK